MEEVECRLEPMSPKAVFLMPKRWGVLAMLLAALLLAVGVPAEAAGHRHGGGAHAAHHHQMAHHHAAHSMAAAHGTMSEHAPAGHAGPDQDSGCHCMSAACASGLLAQAPGQVALELRPLRHDRPAASDALALAGVDPPPEPPRA